MYRMMDGGHTSLACHEVSIIDVPYIFMLCPTILPNAVERDEKIKGIKIDDPVIKIIQYADDTTLVMYADAMLKN